MLRNIRPAILALLLLTTTSLAEASKKTKSRSPCDTSFPTSQWTDCTGLGRYPNLPMPNYEGPWVDGKPHGNGRMFTDTNFYGEYSEYEGQFGYGVKIEKQDCLNEKGYPSSISTTVYRTKNKVKYASREVVDARSGILGAQQKGRAIRIEIGRAELHAEFEAYLSKSDTRRKHSADPVGAGAATVLTLGIPLLFYPKETLRGFIGCSDLVVSEYKPSADRKPRATGKYRIAWGEEISHPEERIIYLSGEHEKHLPGEYENFAQNTVTISIKESRINRTITTELKKLDEKREFAIVELSDNELALLNVDEVTIIEVACTTCLGGESSDLWDSAEWKSFHPAKSISVNADLRGETKKIREKQRRIAEEERQKALAGDGSPDSLICKKRGFTPTTQPYEKCRKDVVLQRERMKKEREAKAIRDAQAAKKVQEERERHRKEEQAQKAAIARAAAEIKAIAPSMSFDDAKEKCANLGFTAGTEKFGSCVLQLTK